MSQPTLKDVLQLYKPIHTISTAASVMDAIYQLPAGQLLVIINTQSQALGVLSANQLTSLPDTQRTLLEYQQEWSPPILLDEQTLLRTTFDILTYDRSIEWCLFLANGLLAGTHAAATIKATYIRLKRSEEADRLKKPGGGGDDPRESDVALPVTRSANDLFGQPFTAAPALCYRCNANPTHRLRPEEIKERDARGRALCPLHRQVMISENPCQENI